MKAGASGCGATTHADCGLPGRVLIQEIIRRKRDGKALETDEIAHFVDALTKGHASDAHAAAFSMAIVFRGLSRDECAALTRAMAQSGRTLQWHDIDGPIVDKHSTGGIGDSVSLILAPAVAACGGYVPMIAGRGLGHTGGTIDKLEAIPGYNTAPNADAFRRCVREVGCAIIGQTDDLAPADKRLYAVRDVTATVESIPLITASILSKKLAAGPRALVLDVKTGSGAFMANETGARELAQSLVDTACAAGLPTIAHLTDMNEPLAKAAGNAVEVEAAIDHLTGAHRDPRLHEVVLALGAEMLIAGGLAAHPEEARRKISEALDSGAAAERFAAMVHALGGAHDILERHDAHLPRAPHVRDVDPSMPGHVREVDARALGLAVVALGGGRRAPGAPIDAAVGLTDLAGIGEEVGPGRPLCRVHARSEADAEIASAAIQRAYAIGDKPAARRPPVIDRILAAPQ
ncbi:MAG: thymidine phosphorylase [Methylobacteriaceae bacterium]|nr:thymidine phosphorylase [Methylobacteriaceae bacterium]